MKADCILVIRRNLDLDQEGSPVKEGARDMGRQRGDLRE